MSKAKFARTRKRQLGQFLTPDKVARGVVAPLDFSADHKILEPSFGQEAFLFAVIERLIDAYEGSLHERLDEIFVRNLYGVELDPALYQKFFDLLRSRYDYVPKEHNLYNCDFFVWGKDYVDSRPLLENLHTSPWPVFDHIVGNPPFGGSIDALLQDVLDKAYGFRWGEKIKKETYSFFLVKCHDLLKRGGSVTFICSDTFLTINTMKGLRNLLLNSGEVSVKQLNYFSDETAHPMLVLNYVKTGRPAAEIRVGESSLSREDISKTKNMSWKINTQLAKYFSDVTVGDYLVATSGMTVGKNELFLREIDQGFVKEPYEFCFFDDPVTVEKETGKARLGALSAKQKAKVYAAGQRGETRRNVKVSPAEIRSIRLPDDDYCYYNKASSDVVYAPPKWVIYWKDEGDAVYTFKKNGNWYLHGVGGKKFFKRSGVTWSLVAARMHTKYLPEGYILDSGSPAAFLRDGTDPDELFFIMGWTLTRTCNTILKEVINHTRNIQGKDFERLPYPLWVPEGKRLQAISLVKVMIELARQGRLYTFASREISQLETLYEYHEGRCVSRPKTIPTSQPGLFK